MVWGVLSKGDIVYYISYLGHKLDKDDLQGLQGQVIECNRPFLWVSTLEVRHCDLYTSSFPNFISPFLLQTLQRNVYQLFPHLYPPLPRVLSLWPFQSPVIGDFLSDLPYLAPSLCFQGALSTSETEYLLHPYKVPKQWGNGACQSSPDENKSRIQNPSAVTASSYELSQGAKLGHREGELISKTPCSGGYRPWCICHWEGMSLLI